VAVVHVGLTRAREQLYLSYAEQRRIYGRDLTYSVPSRFLREIPAELIEELRPRMQVARPVAHSRARAAESSSGVPLGRRVRHRKFGEGVILNSEGSGAHARVQVNFERAGTKWLVMAYANLELM
jgi:DNA helicase-2/ATP-dependent DNA helicase PcrA